MREGGHQDALVPCRLSYKRAAGAAEKRSLLAVRVQPTLYIHECLQRRSAAPGTSHFCFRCVRSWLPSMFSYYEVLERLNPTPPIKPPGGFLDLEFLGSTEGVVLTGEVGVVALRW